MWWFLGALGVTILVVVIFFAYKIIRDFKTAFEFILKNRR